MVDTFGQTNAQQVRNIHPWVFQPGRLSYQRALGTVLVRGPRAIIIRHAPDGPPYTFERIVHVQLLVPNQRRESWSVFRRARLWDEQPEDDRGCILRHSSWDNAADLAAGADGRHAEPTMTTTVRYVAVERCAAIGDPLRALDAAIAAGAGFQRRPASDQREWEEISVFRAVDWGLVDVTWSVQVRNPDWEAAALALGDVITERLTAEVDWREGVWSMTLMYDWTPYLPLG